MNPLFVLFFQFLIGASSNLSVLGGALIGNTRNVRNITADIQTEARSVSEYCVERFSCQIGSNRIPVNKQLLWSDKNCMCDQNCILYGDCCLDSPFYNETEQRTNHKLFKCIQISDVALYLKQSCLLDYTNTTIRFKCENYTLGQKSDDVKIMKPVTDIKRNITYANEYCALCNHITEFHPWPLTFTCYQENVFFGLPKKHDKLTEIINNAVFNQSSRMFESTIDGKNYQCTHDLDKPDLPPTVIRTCHPNLISTCNRAYDQKTLDLCESFTAIVFYGKVPYRNEYCGKCNGDVTDANSCVELTKRGFSKVFSTHGKGEFSDICSSENEEIIKQFC